MGVANTQKRTSKTKSKPGPRQVTQVKSQVSQCLQIYVNHISRTRPTPNACCSSYGAMPTAYGHGYAYGLSTTAMPMA